MSTLGVIKTSARVAEALAAGRPVVALETAVVTHGLPRSAPVELPRLEGLDAGFPWAFDRPLNLQCAMMLSHVVRQARATPAVIGMLDGRLRIGMDDDDLARLAGDESADKASTGNLASIIARSGNAGTTVSATLIGCEAATPRPIRVFATGGIGGVHRGWAVEGRPDVSADLLQLSRSPVCVVCSGGKSILDLPATMEAIETLGITAAGFGTDRLPGFYVEATDIHMSSTVETAVEAAAICRARWGDLGQPGGVLIARPVPTAFAMEPSLVEHSIQLAERDADERGVAGGARTPYLLSRLVELTQGRSLQANLALLAANAALAANIAAEIARDGE